MAEAAAHVRVIEETSGHWRVVFDYPPFNIVDASIFEALQDLLSRMDASPSLRVVVLESANAEFYLANFDLTARIRETQQRPQEPGFNFVGPTVIYAYMQAIGMVTDHTVDCFRYREIAEESDHAN
jgi:enoyl-CoA hydratase/carnithine racemase